MQIYTKILIGMGVGAVIGLTLGPKSSLLEKDTYKVADASKATLLATPGDEGTKLEFPTLKDKKLELVLAAGEVREGAYEKEDKTSENVPRWVEVTFTYSEKLALKDKSGKLAKRLGNPEPGQRVKAWLQLDYKEIENGRLVVVQEPISGLGDTVITYMRPVGELFMKLIKMVIVPLVFASLLVGVASLGDIRKLGRLGGKTLGLYLCTTATAVTIGLVLAHLIQPGSFVADEDKAQLVAQFEGAAAGKADNAAESPSAIDNILNIVPENPIGALSSGAMLQIIFFALIFGIALTLIKEEKSKQVVSFFDVVQDAMIIVIHIVMATAPYGVAALIADVVGTSGISVLKALTVYSITVVLGLGILATVVYGGLVVFISKLKWLDFMRAARPAQLIAFSTSSSSATLPITMECAEDSLGVSKPVSSFVIPLGSTVNMDGTALYQGVAAIFIAQVFGIDLSLTAQLGIVLTATVASIGAAGVPGAGMITLAMVLTTAGIPPVGVALILGVDRLLDMFRTVVNVTGDLAVTTVMATSEGETLRLLTPELDASDPNRGFEGRLDREQHAVQVAEEAEDSPEKTDS